VVKFQILIKALRAPFFTAAAVPVTLGAMIAWNHQSSFYWGYFLLTLIGAIVFHAGVNTANDYFDHKSGADEANLNYYTPLYGGSRVIQNGEMKAGQMLALSIGCFFLVFAIGIYLALTRGLPILWLGLIGFLSGLFYTAPPISLVSRGLGELAVGLNFGVLCTLGAYYVQTQKFSLEALLASLPVSLLIANVLIINEFPDYQADKQVGKRQLVVRLGRKRARWIFLLLLCSTYGLIILFVLLKLIAPLTLLCLLTLPLAIRIGINTWKHYDSSDKLLPSNVGTILAHLSIGTLLCLGYVLQKLL